MLGGPAFRGNARLRLVVAAELRAPATERRGSRISVLPEFWLRDDPWPFLPRLCSLCAGASETPQGARGHLHLRRGVMPRDWNPHPTKSTLAGPARVCPAVWVWQEGLPADPSRVHARTVRGLRRGW